MSNSTWWWDGSDTNSYQGLNPMNLCPHDWQPLTIWSIEAGDGFVFQQFGYKTLMVTRTTEKEVLPLFYWRLISVDPWSCWVCLHQGCWRTVPVIVNSQGYFLFLPYSHFSTGDTFKSIWNLLCFLLPVMGFSGKPVVSVRVWIFFVCYLILEM